jgi:hypothetical protein
MQRLEVSGAVRLIYVIRRLKVNMAVTSLRNHNNRRKRRVTYKVSVLCEVDTVLTDWFL